MKFKTLSNELLNSFRDQIDFEVDRSLDLIQESDIPGDYFEFYSSVSSVYSSKIEGEEIDFDSYYKHRFLNVKYEPDYTKKADDLFKAYEFISKNPLNKENLLKAHSILSKHLLPESQRGRVRTNPMMVLNSNDRIEYVAVEAEKVDSEFEKLFQDIEILIEKPMDTGDALFYAALIHLVFVKIHPLQDGNGRTGRLLEKWFLINKLGEQAVSIELEKNYFKHLSQYYENIRVLGAEYDSLDYSKALGFLTMTIFGIKEQGEGHKT